jgi:hypothetical protein
MIAGPSNDGGGMMNGMGAAPFLGFGQSARISLRPQL